jgi:putative Mg2+ transporter-C (MgtC) family protein
MQPAPEWTEIALRLALAAVAGALVGFDREGSGRPAGLRTNMLVCLAATIAMIQANVLLGAVGKTDGSFVSIDVMRLPLGILTGMGFIGGGAILKKGDVVVGVTTAATLWFVTVVGLCFGGGQTLLGLVSLGIGLTVLSGLKRVENRLPQEWRGLLTLSSTIDNGPTWAAIRSVLLDRKFKLVATGVSYDRVANRQTIRCELRWHYDQPEPIHALMKDLSDRAGVIELDWNPQGLG